MTDDCETWEAEQANKITRLTQEADRIRKELCKLIELQQWVKMWIEATKFIGTHRTCDCAVCERLRKVVGDE